MRIDVSQEPPTALAEYARIPIAFEVSHVLEVTPSETGQAEFILSERPLAADPYIKDYDATPGEGPLKWAQRFDLSNWVLFTARSAVQPVGGAAVASATPALSLLDDRTDLAELWDIRVSPAHRGQGIGTALFRAVEVWARARGCRFLKIETQNINVAACRFYQQQGCVLETAHRGADPDFPHEIKLIWCRHLGVTATVG